MTKIKSKIILLVTTILLSSVFIFSGCGVSSGGNNGDGSESGPSNPLHTHSFVNVVNDKYLVSPANCTRPAVYYRSCACGEKDSVTFESGEPTGHNFVVKAGLEPTCINSGYTEYEECLKCGYIKDYEDIELLWHDYVDGVCTRCHNVKSTSTDLKYFNFTLIDNKGTQLEIDDEYEISLKDEYKNELADEVPDEIVIPSTFNYDYKMGKVTYIAESGFANHKIKEITIPNSVTTIGPSAFAYTGLNSTITIPSGAKFSGGGIFYNSGFKSIILQDDLDGIPSYCFYNCRYLSSITIPNSVNSIDDNAFSGCKKLKNIIIPDSVEWVYEKAFDNCDPELYDEKDGVLYVDSWAVGVKDKTTLDDVIIKDGTVGLCSNLFYVKDDENLQEPITKCSITSVELPSSVKYIGHYAFSNCIYLNRIQGGFGIIRFDEYSFKNCVSLTSLTLYNNVASVNTQAFYGCKKLSSLSILSGKVAIDGSAFAYCPISNISVNPNSLHYCVEEGCLIDDGNGVIIIGNKTGKIPEVCSHILSFENGNRELWKIGDYAFAGRVTFDSVIIPDYITTIGKYAFADCKNLETIILPATGTNKHKIDEYSFMGCVRLKTVNFTDAISYIGYGAFSNTGFVSLDLTNLCHLKLINISALVFSDCKNLEEITIAAEQNNLQAFMFNGCDKLTKINYLGTIEQWNNIIKTANWDYGTPDYIVHCVDGEVAKEVTNN